MLKRLLALPILVSGCLLGSSAAFGAAIAVGEANVPEGTAEATVEWSFENSAENVTEIFFDITFSTDFISPQVTEQEVFPGVFQDVPDGCLDNVSGINNQACILIDDGNPSVIRISLDNSPNPLPNFIPGGTITFDIEPTAEIGDDTPLELSIETMLPGDANVALNDGAVNIVDVTAILNVQPDELDFGTQQTGGISAPQSVTVSNDGADGVDLEITGINVTGEFDNAGGTCTVGTILADTQTCTIDVTFSPLTDGGKVGQVQVSSDAGEVTNDTVDLAGEGIPTDAELTIDPTDFDFGPLDIDDPAECTDFTLANTAGDDSLTIGTASIGLPFTVTDNCDGAMLGGGDSCVVEVCFDPDTEDTFVDTLSVTSDVNNVEATVEGEGTAESDVSINFPGDMGVDAPGETIIVNGSVDNSGSADAEVSCSATGDTTVISTDPATPFVQNVPANGSTSVTFTCDLPAEGEEGAEFSITMSCSVDGGEPEDHVVSCGISTFEPLPVPTMQAWALALFALLMLLAGGIGIRYFRAD